MPRRTRIHIDGLPLHIVHPGLRRSSVPALGVDPAILPNVRRQVMGYESLDGAQRNPGWPAAPSRAAPMCPALPPDSAIAPSGLSWLAAAAPEAGASGPAKPGVKFSDTARPGGTERGIPGGKGARLN